MTGIDLYYEWVALESSTTTLGFTPFQWCANGTVSNCGGVLGDSNDTVPFEACGPDFGDGSNGLGDDPVIQGAFQPIVSA